MASAKEIEKRKVILRARGVPEKFIDNIARRKGYGYWLAVWMTVWLTFCALMLTSAFGLLFSDNFSGWLAPLTYRWEQESLLFFAPDDLAFALSFVISGLIVAVAIVAAARFRQHTILPFPAYSAFADYLRGVRPYETLDTIVPEPRLAAMDHFADDTAFLKNARPTQPKQPVVIPLAAATLFVVFSLSRTMTLFDTTSVDREAIRLGSVTGETVYPLRTAKFAYVTCYDNPGSSTRFDYHIVFSQGTFSIWESHDPVHKLDRGAVLDRIDQIDRQLANLKVPVYRAPPTGIPNYNPSSCVSTLSRDWDLKSPETLRRLVLG